MTVSVPPTVTPEAIARILCSLMGEPEFEYEIDSSFYRDEFCTIHHITLPRDHEIRFSVSNTPWPSQFTPPSTPYWAAVCVEVVKLVGGSLWLDDSGGAPNLVLPRLSAEYIEALDTLVEHLKPVKWADALKWRRYVAYPHEKER